MASLITSLGTARVRIFRPFTAVNRCFTTADRRFKTADRRLKTADRRLKTTDRRFQTADRRFTKIDRAVADEVLRFSLDAPVHEALTPPSSWYRNPGIHDLEADTVWRNNWVAVGRTDQVSTPGAFFTGTIGREPFIVSSDRSNTLRAFYNVCCHHGNVVEWREAGEASEFVCCYHGWTYAMDGSRLRKPTKLRGIKNFVAAQNGLKPIGVRTWGPLVFLRLAGYPDEDDFDQKVGPLAQELEEMGFTSGMRHICRRQYRLRCNWKLIVDNAADSGYHLEYVHRDLSSNLDLSTFRTEVGDIYNMQVCIGKDDNDNTLKRQRVGSKALYSCIYPNLLVNRYGPWLDINILLPLGPDRSLMIYDFYLKESFAEEMSETELAEFIEQSLKDSDQVQQEDTRVCEGVQRGMESTAFDVGRYAPGPEMPVHAFHLQLARDLREGLEHHESMYSNN
ncbi:hypothetical protein Bbelb_015970 [Branchiostoma belcheri]|nr:hypothetical protein Bbelb_015970 [Branchiostoma belcheri]